MGPTASGKSALATELAREFEVEIVSVDSAQVYRDMNIGTAKPSASERAAIPHHLIDLVDPTEAYSAARFRTDALAAIAAIHARGRLPLLVGGTMLYFKALRDGLSALPQADPELRAQLDREAATLGWPAMHAELLRVDPTTAARLAPNDSQRIQRALEVYRASGVSMSTLLGVERDLEPLPFTITQVALVPADRNALHARIAERFDAMLASGLVDEVRALRERYVLDPDLPSMRAVGYRQVWAYLEGDSDRTTLRESGIAATRQLAKRQLTWLRSWLDVTTLDPFAENPLARVKALISALR
jgi:tRNA dimethylallyltransferase